MTSLIILDKVYVSFISAENRTPVSRVVIQVYVSSIQGDEFISEDEDDELIQIRRKRVNEFVNKCSRRP